MIVRATAAGLAAAGFTGAAPFAGAPGTIAFLAVAESGTQGWCWGCLLPRPDGPPMLYLHDLRVAEPWRGQGIGRALLTAFRDEGAHRGATRMFLTTGEHNEAARHLYEKVGGTRAEQGPTVNYWFRLAGPGNHEVRPGSAQDSLSTPTSHEEPGCATDT